MFLVVSRAFHESFLYLAVGQVELPFPRTGRSATSLPCTWCRCLTCHVFMAETPHWGFKCYGPLRPLGCSLERSLGSSLGCSLGRSVERSLGLFPRVFPRAFPGASRAFQATPLSLAVGQMESLFTILGGWPRAFPALVAGVSRATFSWLTRPSSGSNVKDPCGH